MYRAVYRTERLVGSSLPGNLLEHALSRQYLPESIIFFREEDSNTMMLLIENDVSQKNVSFRNKKRVITIGFGANN